VLRNATVFALDMGNAACRHALSRDSRSGSSRSSRARGLSRAILFIDEIHTVIGAGATSARHGRVELLKPALASGTVRCIGSTTYKNTGSISRRTRAGAPLPEDRLNEPTIPSDRILKG